MTGTQGKSCAIFQVEKLLGSSLIAKAEEFIRKRLADTPDDTGLIRRLGDLCRQQGKLKDAAEAYRRWKELEPDNPMASYLCGWAGLEKAPSKWPEREKHIPARFVVKDDFLPPEFKNEILRHALEERGKFDISPMSWGYGEKKIKRVLHDQRRSRQIRLSPELKKQFLDMVSSELPSFREHLGMPEYPVREYREMLVRHGDGDFLIEHQDDYHSPHWLSLVYFFAAPERDFTGGETILFDSDRECATFNSSSFSLFPFIDNRLLAFSGRNHHGVLPVKCKEDGFEQGRFSIVLWLVPED